MPKGRVKYLPIPALIIDTILLFNSFFTAGFIVFNGEFPDPVFYYKLLIGGILLWVLIAINFKLYDLPRIFYLDKIVSKNIYAVAVFAVISCTIIFFITDYKFSRVFFVIAFSTFTIMLSFWHTMLVILFKVYRAKGYNFRTVIVVGFNNQLEQLINEVLLIPENGYRIHGFFGSNKPTNQLQKFYKGKPAELLDFLKNNPVDELLISLPDHQSALTNEIMNYADNNLIRVQIVPSFSNYLFQKFKINYVKNIPTLNLRNEPLESLSNRIEKRVFDIVFSLLVLLFIGIWLFPILALLIKITSKGPVFFSQMRSGKDGKSFKCLKFRSMTVNRDSDTLQATKNDARITKIGKFIRKTSLDEFPQFFNVLFSNMSVVGPRPHMLKHTEQYQQLVDKFMVRHFAKPGITGWAQVKGFRGETKEVQDMANRAEADIWYIENWSIMLDLKIVMLTVWQVVFKRDENAF